MVVPDREPLRVHGNEVGRTQAADGRASRALMLTAAGQVGSGPDGLAVSYSFVNDSDCLASGLHPVHEAAVVALEGTDDKPVRAR